MGCDILSKLLESVDHERIKGSPLCFREVLRIALRAKSQFAGWKIILHMEGMMHTKIYSSVIHRLITVLFAIVMLGSLSSQPDDIFALGVQAVYDPTVQTPQLL